MAAFVRFWRALHAEESCRTIVVVASPIRLYPGCISGKRWSEEEEEDEKKIPIIAGRKISTVNSLDLLIAHRSTRHIGFPVVFSPFVLFYRSKFLFLSFPLFLSFTFVLVYTFVSLSFVRGLSLLLSRTKPFLRKKIVRAEFSPRSFIRRTLDPSEGEIYFFFLFITNGRDIFW